MNATRCSVLTLMALGWPSSTQACLWDRDTVAAEARLSKEADGRFDIVASILGLVDELPPLYYEMRLKRVTEAIEKGADDLSLYDDAAVACDRLGNQTAAIEWMEKKKHRMDARGNTVPAAQRYRYLANLGTFHAHRWVKSPRRFDDKSELQSAIDLINQAIVENPQAHFGREVYQLILLDWLKEAVPGPNPSDALQPLYRYFQLVDAMQNSRGRRGKDTEAISGLAGLVQLGSAGRSLDVMALICVGADAAGKRSLANLAQLRTAELGKVGSAIYPKENYNITLRSANILPTTSTLRPLDRSGIERFYRDARNAVEHRTAELRSYVSERLGKGKHPDVDADFWADWKEPIMPKYPH